MQTQTHNTGVPHRGRKLHAGNRQGPVWLHLGLCMPVSGCLSLPWSSRNVWRSCPICILSFLSCSLVRSSFNFISPRLNDYFLCRSGRSLRALSGLFAIAISVDSSTMSCPLVQANWKIVVFSHKESSINISPASHVSRQSQIREEMNGVEGQISQSSSTAIQP